MKFITHNDDRNIFNRLNRSHGQGQIEATYPSMVRVFGKPDTEHIDNNKSDVVWTVEFADGTMVCIYNWKDGWNYLGDEGTPTWEITEWHISGVSNLAVTYVLNALSTQTEYGKGDEDYAGDDGAAVAKMNFLTHNDDEDLFDWDVGTRRRGEINADYAFLVETFGPPLEKNLVQKDDIEWILLFEDDTIATIFNKREEREGINVSEIKSWCVGGFSQRAVTLIQAILSSPKRKIKADDGCVFGGKNEARSGRNPDSSIVITLEVKESSGEPLLFRCNQWTPLQRVIDTFAIKKGRNPSDLLFMFQGAPLDGEMTLQMLHLKNDDQIDVF